MHQPGFFEIADAHARLSFKRFLGLRVAQKSPDAKTIWLWRERVFHSGLQRK